MEDATVCIDGSTSLARTTHAPNHGSYFFYSCNATAHKKSFEKTMKETKETLIF